VNRGHEVLEILEDLLRGLAGVKVVAARAQEDHARPIREDHPIREVGGVHDPVAPKPRLITRCFGKSSCNVVQRTIVEEPTKRIASFGGGLVRSAALECGNVLLPLREVVSGLRGLPGADGIPGRTQQTEDKDDPGAAEMSVHFRDHYKLDVAIHWLKSGRPGGPGDLRNLL
jgi:hypothetical protein